MAKFVCDHPWTHFEVNNPNGDVTMCCDNAMVLGNVNDQSVTEVWNGHAYQDIRRRMRDDGAHAICPHTCPVLHGFKTYQNLDWHSEAAKESPMAANALQNDQEYAAGKLVLASMPRWMRFAYSYACNLDCYHCYQRDEAQTNLKVPSSFIDQIYEYAAFFQVVFFFGGEPFLYKPVLRMIEEIGTGEDCRFFFVTNATLLTDRIFSLLEARRIGHFAVSLDAATENSFDVLRRRGAAKASWETVMANLGRIASLRKTKGFSFTVSMTLNSVNSAEIESFVDLGIAHDAEPLVLLVANPFQTMDFQRDFLTFTPPQFAEMERQIARSLEKVRVRGYREAEMALRRLGGMLKHHRRTENGPLRYAARTQLRRIFHTLPEPLQVAVRKAVRVG